MSLEQTLNETNDLLRQLLTRLNTALEAEQTLGEPAKKRTRSTKASTETAEAPAAETAAPAITTAPNNVLGTVEGDPEGTRYFWIASHNTVYAQKPGDPDCTLPGAEIVTAAYYLQKKADGEAATRALIAKNNEVARADTAALLDKAKEISAASTAAAAPAPAPAPAVTPTAEAVSFQQVIARITALNRSTLPGHGREGVLSVLRKFLPGDDRPTATKLATLSRNEEVLAEIDRLMAVDADFDPLA